MPCSAWPREGGPSRRWCMRWCCFRTSTRSPRSSSLAVLHRSSTVCLAPNWKVHPSRCPCPRPMMANARPQPVPHTSSRSNRKIFLARYHWTIAAPAEAAAEGGATSAQSQITITQRTTITAAGTAEPAMVLGSTIWVSNISPCTLYSVHAHSLPLFNPCSCRSPSLTQQTSCTGSVEVPVPACARVFT